MEKANKRKSFNGYQKSSYLIEIHSLKTNSSYKNKLQFTEIDVTYGIDPFGEEKHMDHMSVHKLWAELIALTHVDEE